MVRVLFVPVMVWLLWSAPSPLEAFVAAFCFVFAMLLDVLDGYLARKWDIQSIVGSFLDPIADKMMVMTSLIMLIPLGWVPAWLVILLEIREMAISGLRSVAMGEGLVISASSLGKFKTAYQSTAIAFLILHYPIDWLFGPSFIIDAHSVGLSLLWVATGFAWVSGLEYAWGFYVHYNKKHAA